MGRVVEFVSSHRSLVTIVVVVALVGGAFYAGRSSIEPVAVVQYEAERQTTSETESKTEGATTGTGVSENTTVVEETVEHPDGTKVHRRTTSNTKTEIQIQTVTVTEVKEVIKTEEVVKYEEKKVTVKEKLYPDWRVTGTVDLLTYVREPGHFVAGAQVDRRIIGPVYAGIWANTNMQAGLAVSITF